MRNKGKPFTAEVFRRVRIWLLEDTQSWYALQTYYAQEQKVGSYLRTRAISYFIPMKCYYETDTAGRPLRHYRPVVHNLIFVRKTMEADKLRAIFEACPFAIRVYTHTDNKNEWYEIADRDILDLRLICDDTFTEPQIITQEESDMQVGRMVRVVHGPLKGMRGKLVRKKKKYYVVKSLVGMGIMVAVSRWCCSPDNE